MKAIDDILKYLNKNGIQYRVEKENPVRSASDLNRIGGVQCVYFIKSVIMKVDTRYMMIVIRHDRQIDEQILKRELNTPSVRCASFDEVAAICPHCEMGAVPPFGNLFGLPVVIEKAITNAADILFHNCTSTHSIRIRVNDFLRLVEPKMISPGEWSKPSGGAPIADTAFNVPEEEYFCSACKVYFTIPATNTLFAEKPAPVCSYCGGRNILRIDSDFKIIQHKERAE